jgi:phospholipase C
MDHVVVVLFENRSLDNVLGHLYGPDDGKTFEGVIGKELLARCGLDASVGWSG